MASEREINRDLTLTPDSYLYLQNVGKGGVITVHRGPCVVSQTGQDQPVRYDSQARQYRPCDRLEQAVQICPRAVEGDYVILENPAEDNGFPKEISQQARPLRKGRKVIIPGPWSEAMWPGQSATVIEGHRLRSNQYLVAVIYNEEEAEVNWDKTVVKPQTEAVNTQQVAVGMRGLPKPERFAVGTRIVIRGSDVSFYIPCTGIEIARDENQRYVREAVTVEQNEYCCLVDESGKKEYPRGPKVVFPRPTQVFDQDSKGRRKFRPVELNTINGLHLKVTCNFEDEDLEQAIDQATGKRPIRKYREGDELFVTGRTLQIYYPREEFSVVQYGSGNRKHYSTAVPKGEARYLINRETGEIDMVRGPKMLLPDPRSEILVRRILSEDDCKLWYPGNAAAVQYNRELAAVMAASPSGRSGVVSEGDYRKSQQKRLTDKGGGIEEALIGASDFSEYSPEETGEEGGSIQTMTRGTKYTAPRQITLNTKFDGVPRIEVWPGYAVLIVGAEGSRRVVVGPEVVLMEYDEKLGFMELSTGKPKNTDHLYRTSFLCIQDNQVGDVIAFESADHVKGKVKISMRVNFEGTAQDDKLRWFSVSNYVKYLCDHVRSMVAGVAKKRRVAEIKGDYVNIIREAILGQKQPQPTGAGEPGRSGRPGLTFTNGMRVVEVEVLDLALDDQKIAQLLDAAQHKVVEANIQLEQARRDLDATRERERIAQEKLQAEAETAHLLTNLETAKLEDQAILLVKQVEVELKKIDGDRSQRELKESITDLAEQRKLARAKAEVDHALATDQRRLALKKEEIEATTSAAVARFTAAKDGLYEALTTLQRDDIAVKLQEACTVERWLSGDSVSSSISNLLSLYPALQEFLTRAGAGSNGGGRANRLKQPEVLPTVK